MSSNWTWPTAAFEAVTLDHEADGVADRQNRIAGFSTSLLASARILLIGAGGLGSAIATGLARKGVGALHLVDADVVEVSNLNRQHFFEADLYQPKALRLAHNAARQGFLGTKCIGHHVGFRPDTAEALSAGIDVAVVGVDNNLTRAVTSPFFRRRRVPVIFTAVNERADFGWVFVQEAEGACVACVFPRMAQADALKQSCTPSPAALDILLVVGGITLYAIDTLLMSRPRQWNYHAISLVGDGASCVDRVPPKLTCPLCGSGRPDAAAMPGKSRS